MNIKAFLLGFLIAVGVLTPLAARSQTPLCFPLVNGVHVGVPRYIDTDRGTHFYWVCSPRGGEPRPYGFSCLKGECSKTILEGAISAVTRSTAKLSTAQAQFEQHVQFNCDDVENEQTPRGALCRERARILIVFGDTWFPRPAQ